MGFGSRKSRSVGGSGRACIDELEAKVDDRYKVGSESPCSLEETRKAALLGRHCCLEKGSFSGLRRELLRHYRQRRRCDLMFAACRTVGTRRI